MQTYKIYFAALIAILLVCLPVSVAGASQSNTISINDLVSKGNVYDGQTITLTAEAIGEPMKRGDHCWVNVSDGTNAIGLWLTKTEAASIRYYGSYQSKGDNIRITGIYHNACKEHGGEADLHVTDLKILETGHLTIEHVSTTELSAALIFSGAALFVIIPAVRILLRKNKQTV